MEEMWCLKDGDYTSCKEPSGYQRDKKKTDYSFIASVLSVEVKKLDM